VTRHPRLAGATILALLALAAPSSAQLSSDTPTLSGQGGKVSDLYNEGVPAVTDALTHDFNGGALEDFTRAAHADVKTLGETRKSLLKLAANPKMSSELAAEGLKAAAENEAEAQGAASQAGFAQKLSKVLDVIDLVSTTSKASAYATEGDFSGATKIIVGEMTKKLMEGAAMAGLSWMPGGQFVGALAGEQAYEAKVEPILAANEKALRDQQYADTYLGKPWLPEHTRIDQDGNVHVMAPDEYIDRDTGNVQRRSPEDQAAYEAQQHIKYRDSLQWAQIMKDLAAGKIDAAHYDGLLTSFRERDTTKPWDPNAPVLLGAARFAGQYVGSFSGGGAGAIHFTVDGNAVSGTLHGICTTSPCENDPVSGSFHGSITNDGIISTTLSGEFNIESKLIGPVGFGGELNGAVAGKSAQGVWTGKNRYGAPTGSWTASRP
jgi:hypothetical protein